MYEPMEESFHATRNLIDHADPFAYVEERAVNPSSYDHGFHYSQEHHCNASTNHRRSEPKNGVYPDDDDADAFSSSDEDDYYYHHQAAALLCMRMTLCTTRVCAMPSTTPRRQRGVTLHARIRLATSTAATTVDVFATTVWSFPKGSDGIVVGFGRYDNPRCDQTNDRPPVRACDWRIVLYRIRKRKFR
jgi:hypothetical protein